MKYKNGSVVFFVNCNKNETNKSKASPTDVYPEAVLTPALGLGLSPSSPGK